MMQTNNWLNASLMQPLQHLAITLQCLTIKTTFFRHNPAPYERKPAGFQSEVAGDIEVLLGVLPPIARPTAGISGLNPACLLPVGPLIAVVAFDLMRRRRHAPQKILRKSEKRFGTRGAKVQFTHGLHSTT